MKLHINEKDVFCKKVASGRSIITKGVKWTLYFKVGSEQMFKNVLLTDNYFSPQKKAQFILMHFVCFLYTYLNHTPIPPFKHNCKRQL